MLKNYPIRTNMKDIKKSAGLTLIELLVTLAVVAILISFGGPKLAQYSEKNRVVAQVNKISGGLSAARSEAIKRGVNVTVCGSTNSTDAVPACDTSQWELGWIYFSDEDNDGNFDSATETLLGISEPLAGGLTMRSNDFDAADKVRFMPNGTVRDTDGDGDSDGTFTVCTPDGDQTKARAVNVNTLVRSSIARDSNNNNIVEDVNTNSVTCP
jgi:type IV fimbrial biogenesis protein FimT